MLNYIVLTILSILFIVIIRWILSPYWAWKRNKQSNSNSNIRVTNTDGKKYNLAEYTKLREKSQVFLSLVVPSYNQQKRLPIMLDQTLEYLQKQPYSYQIIIVNDGSKDKTTQVALQYGKKKRIPLVVVQYPVNRGKGGAVRAGMQIAVGDYHLMVDADGATQFSDLTNLMQRMKQSVNQKLLNKESTNLVLIAGSRHHIAEAGEVKRYLHRRFVSFVLHVILRYICGIKINDTQCGFKLFTKQTSRILFRIMHLERWSFDIELLIIANKFKVHCEEIPVTWEDIEGSKLNIVEASLSIFRDIALIKLLYFLNIWKYNDQVNIV